MTSLFYLVYQIIVYIHVKAQMGPIWGPVALPIYTGPIWVHI